MLLVVLSLLVLPPGCNGYILYLLANTKVVVRLANARPLLHDHVILNSQLGLHGMSLHVQTMSCGYRPHWCFILTDFSEIHAVNLVTNT